MNYSVISITAHTVHPNRNCKISYSSTLDCISGLGIRCTLSLSITQNEGKRKQACTWTFLRKTARLNGIEEAASQTTELILHEALPRPPPQITRRMKKMPLSILLRGAKAQPMQKAIVACLRQRSRPTNRLKMPSKIPVIDLRWRPPPRFTNLFSEVIGSQGLILSARACYPDQGSCSAEPDAVAAGQYYQRFSLSRSTPKNAVQSRSSDHAGH